MRNVVIATVAAAAFVAGSLTGEKTKPAENVVEPVAVAVGVVDGTCPSGWKDISTKALDVVVLACERGEWTVWLNPDRSFSHAWAGSGDFVYNPTDQQGRKVVEGWP